MAFYVVFEGIDGSGKTTQAKKLYDSLVNQGKKVFLFHEPTDTKVGQLIKNMIRKGNIYGKDAISLAFALDRVMYKYEKLNSVLKEYDVVIGDRSFYSSITYQKVMGLDLEWLKQINKYVIVPDLAIILNISLETQMKRRGETNIIFENKVFQERLIREYENLPKYFPSNRIIFIDGEKTIDQIHKKVMNLLYFYSRWEK